MIKSDIEESAILVISVLSVLLSLVLGMRNDGQKQQQGGAPRPGRPNGFIPSSFRAISSYLRIVSSGASTVARSAASVASSIVDRDDDANHDQVNWAGFDKLEGEGDAIWQVLLLGYWSGFQVWDVEDANNVRDLVSRHDGPVSFMQMLPKPIASKRLQDKFAESHPVLVVCADGSISVGSNIQNGSRVVAIFQAARIHCFDATTLESEYTILTNPIVMGCPGSGGIGYGPLAVGPRWLAYSGSPVVVSNSGRHLVAHYAKESSKQLAAGIVTLGDMGYKKLSRYCSELLPDGNTSVQSGSPGWKGNGTVNGHLTDAENIGMVIVRDIVSKVVIAQFRAHRSPISALCFDPSGTLLVTASVQGHNINVFKIMPGQSVSSSASDAGASYVHLYRLQRGFTNAVIQDISFSDDSSWIMISSSRGTSHLFAINPLGGSVNFQSADAGCTIKNSSLGATTKPAVRWPPSQQSLCAAGPPVTLSVVSRIRNGTNGWKGTLFKGKVPPFGFFSFWLYVTICVTNINFSGPNACCVWIKHHS
ncbi:autophagy-related protein 18f-like isoform X2 [Fagus crenata]